MVAENLVMNVNKIMKRKYQAASYILLSSALFLIYAAIITIIIFSPFEKIFSQKISLIIYVILFLLSPSINMLLSILILPMYLRFYILGVLKILENKRIFILLNLSLLILFLFLITVANFIKNTYFDPAYFVLPILMLPIPVLLMLSPIAFVVHNRLFANLYFLALLSPYFIIVIPLVYDFHIIPLAVFLLPLLIYYPLMIKYTNHLRRKYNINLPIKPDPIIAWFKKLFNKLFQKPFNKLFKKAEVKRLHKPPNKPPKTSNKPPKKAEVKPLNKP